MAINTVTLSGRLIAAPELRYTPKGTAVAGGRIAVDDGYGDSKKAYFFDYTAWAHTAEYMAKYTDKGTPVTIQGKLIQEAWQAQDGTRRSRVVVQVQEVVLPPKGNIASNHGQTDCLSGEEITFDTHDLPF